MGDHHGQHIPRPTRRIRHEDRHRHRIGSRGAPRGTHTRRHHRPGRHRELITGELLRYYGREDTTRYLLDGPWDAAKARHEVTRRAGRLHITAAGYAVCLVVEVLGSSENREQGRGTPTGAPATEGDIVVGDITLWAVDESLSLGEMSWVFDPDASGHGWATEAARAVLGLAFDHYGMHRVRVRMDARNTASARLSERLGFRREGLLRQDWFIAGEWTDTLVYGMLAGERGERHQGHEAQTPP